MNKNVVFILNLIDYYLILVRNDLSSKINRVKEIRLVFFGKIGLGKSLIVNFIFG